ncbi:hypothetical protein [Actinomadura citrea]|uniref:Uncharacterized protein n=1 Tax=Actinomadura citrea TaxID=46158 RepID=A0A7Y9KFI3_9ACTN|nr:hypothetical protein [Actinomadura citrea]NYE14003.1 hypothetical protein [Actinomadura citrea]GGU01523.1 hypothetical protein GCM10010177_70980 [Actinomadura citrea]
MESRFLKALAISSGRSDHADTHLFGVNSSHGSMRNCGAAELFGSAMLKAVDPPVTTREVLAPDLYDSWTLLQQRSSLLIRCRRTAEAPVPIPALTPPGLGVFAY